MLFRSQVALSGPPKNVTKMPQKAERAPDAPKASAPDAPVPPPNASDMAFHTPDAPKTKGDPNADAAMKKAMEELKMRQALQDLSAPIGTQDRAASSPDGEDEGSSSATSGIRDPETARWIEKARQAINANWHPLRSVCASNPRMEVVVQVPVDPSGNQTSSPEVVQRSGNVSFDEAARRATEATGRLPPPPAKYASGVTATLSFKGKDCQ